MNKTKPLSRDEMAKLKRAFPYGSDKPPHALPAFTVGPRPTTEQGRREEAEAFIEDAKRRKGRQNL